jgi:exodeoxyribonuclease III
MKLATWNVNSLTVRLAQLLQWLELNPVDVLVLQETKLTDDKFPHQALQDAGYAAQWFGQKTYNGVALLTRINTASLKSVAGPLPRQTCPPGGPDDANAATGGLTDQAPALDVVKNIPGFDDDQARLITATVQGIRVVGAYMPNGQAPESDKFAYKLRWLTALHAFLKGELEKHPHLVVMGDFNIAPTDADVHDPVAWADQIHCTSEERAHFQSLLDLGLIDAFRLFEQAPKSWSWWDYRQLAFRKNQGLRIDHVLISQALKSQASACVIDKAPRRNERPSDHAPVVLELAG